MSTISKRPDQYSEHSGPGEVIIGENEWTAWSSYNGQQTQLSTDNKDAVGYKVVCPNNLSVTGLSFEFRINYADTSGELVPEEFFPSYTKLYLTCKLYSTNPTAGSPSPIQTRSKTFSQYPHSETTTTVSFSGVNISSGAAYLVISGYAEINGQRVQSGGVCFIDVPSSTSVTLSGEFPAPSVGVPTTAIVQPSGTHSDFANTYISGYSKCKISASVTAAAGVSRVYFTYPEYSGYVSMSYNSSTGKYEGTTTLAISQNTVFTVTAVDTANQIGQNAVQLSGVQSYTAPSVTVTNAYRCNSSGTEEEGGAYYKIRILASFSSVNNRNSVTQVTVSVKNMSGSTHTLSKESGTNYYSGGPYSGLSSSDTVYVITVIIVDKVGSQVTTEFSLGGRLRDVVFKRASNAAHVGIGMAPDPSVSGGNSTLQLPPNARIIIGGQDITAWLRQQIGGSW